MKRNIILLVCLFYSTMIFSQYSIKVGMGFDYISQVPHDDKTPNSKFIMGEYQVSPTWAIGLGYRRFVNTNSFGGWFSTSILGEEIIFEGREDGQIRSNEFFASIIKGIRSFSLQLDLGYVRSKMDNRFWLQNINNSDDSIVEDGFYNKSYQRKSFFRSALSLDYNFRIIDQVELVPYVQFMIDLRNKGISYTVESVDEIPDEFLSAQFKEFNKTVKGISQENKYVVFGVALKYDFGKRNFEFTDVCYLKEKIESGDINIRMYDSVTFEYMDDETLLDLCD